MTYCLETDATPQLDIRKIGGRGALYLLALLHCRFEIHKSVLEAQDLGRENVRLRATWSEIEFLYQTTDCNRSR